MKQILLTTILLLSSISFYGDNLSDVKEILSKQVNIEKAEINLWKLKTKADDTNAVNLAELQAHKNKLKEVKSSLKEIKKAVKAKKKLNKAEKKYEKRQKTYNKHQDKINKILAKYSN